MRLALYIRSVQSARGAERVSINLARALAARGHCVDFLVEEDGSWLTDELRAEYDNVTLINLKAARRSRLSNIVAWAGACVLCLITAPRALLETGDACVAPILRLVYKDAPPLAALLQYIRDKEPRAILSFLNYPNIALLLASFLSRPGTRFIISVHNTISVAAAHNESKWLRSVPRLMRRLYQRADAIVAVSGGVAADTAAITALPQSRITTIYNPVVRPEIEVLANASPDHPWLSEGNVPVILAAGKLKPQKDFQTLLQAFAEIRRQRPARLVILGEGASKEELLAYSRRLGVDADVDFPGHVRNPFAYYKRASVFVLSSLWEGLPTVLIEAMACGCPVVSTDCPSGPHEILEGGRYGTLVPVGSADDIARAVLAVMADPPPRAMLIERARDFAVENVVARFEAVMVG
jgi:glycosyltransferase involved in cell wall biosynthesis